MKINELIEIVESALKATSFNTGMQDVNGDWYDDYEIERDLGCTISHYDWLTETKSYLLKLRELGVEDVSFSIRDTYYMEETKLLLKKSKSK